jgi:mevalonate kinase
MSKKYPSKILLFGEYTVIEKGAALAVPYHTLGGQWAMSHEPSPNIKASQTSLRSILQHIRQKPCPPLNIDQLAQDLDRGLWFDSNIPTGYGLGSSGAVCAAIYDRYSLQKETKLEVLKQELAQLENCFHGSSSGIDPLVAYVNDNILIDVQQKIKQVNLSTAETKGAIFLLDTQIPRQSTPLIHFFMDNYKQPIFQQNYVLPAKQAAQQAIDALLSDQPTSELLEATQILSTLQFQYLPPMVPPSMHAIWQKGLETEDYFIKICGAGGGGFLLGVTPNWEQTKAQYLSEYIVTPIYRF